MTLLPGQVEEPPPGGVIAWAVVIGAKCALFHDRPDAERYAVRMHSVAWPLVVAKRTSDPQPPPPEGVTAP